MKPYKAYLFDLDGTLIDTMELIYQCFRHTYKHYAGKEISRDEVMGNVGLPLRQHLEEAFGPQADEQLADMMMTHMEFQFDNYAKYLSVFPGVIDTLTILKKRGAQIAMVSSRRMDSAGVYLKHVGIFEYFDLFITPAEVKHHKPHAESALKAMELLESTPQQSLFIGDSNFDIECGFNAGIDTAFVSWSHYPAQSLKAVPTYTLRTIEDLLKIEE